MKLKLKHITLLFVLSIVKASAMESIDRTLEDVESFMDPKMHHYKQVADVSFEIRAGSLIGREKGKDVFRYKISNFNDCIDYTSGNFAIQKLDNELRWRYMSPDEKYCEISVNSNGDMELLETPQTHTNTGMFLFKTHGTVINRGNQAFFWLALHANQFHNYGTLQTWTHNFWYSYEFNSGVIKCDDFPFGIADLRTDAMKNSTQKPVYQDGVIDNYGQEIYSGTLQIKDGLSHNEHGESVFENLEMSGGALKVDGSLTVSGKISGEVRDLVLADNAEFNANEIAFTKLRNLKIGKNARVYSPNSYSLTVENTYENAGSMNSGGKISLYLKVIPKTKQEGIILAGNIFDYSYERNDRPNNHRSAPDMTKDPQMRQYLMAHPKLDFQSPEFLRLRDDFYKILRCVQVNSSSAG